MQEDREVAKLLRDFMRGDGNRRADAERYRRHYRRRDHRAIDEVVERVPDDDTYDAAVVDLAVVRVTVPPEHQLLEDEEKHDADEQRRKQASRSDLLNRFGKDLERGRTEQRAHCVADQPGDNASA